MKKTIIVLLLTMLMLCVFVGCANSGVDTDSRINAETTNKNGNTPSTENPSSETPNMQLTPSLEASSSENGQYFGKLAIGMIQTLIISDYTPDGFHFEFHESGIHGYAEFSGDAELLGDGVALYYDSEGQGINFAFEDESVIVRAGYRYNSLVSTYSSVYPTQYGNTSGNISNGAFTAQDGDSIYYVLPTDPEYVLGQGELIKVNLDGSVSIDLLSYGSLNALNIVNGWIYYISGSFMNPDGLIYKVRIDGTENILITSAISEQGVLQGYTTREMGIVLKMIVVDNWIYCRVFERINGEPCNVIYRIKADNGEVERLQKVGASMHGMVVYGDWIYYGGTSEVAGVTYRMRTDGTENTKIAEVLFHIPSIENDKIYFIGGDLQIYSMELDGTNIERIADGIAAVSINVTDNWIYYSTGSAIYKVRTSGADIIKLCDYASTGFIQINVINDWIYLLDRASGMHKVKTDGSELQEVK